MKSLVELMFKDLKNKLWSFTAQNEIGPAIVISAITIITLGSLFTISDNLSRSKFEKPILERMRILEGLDENLDYSLLGAEVLYVDELLVMDSFR